MLDRRQILCSLAAAAAAAPTIAATKLPASPPAAKRWTSEFLQFDPVAQFRNAMRLQRSL